MRLNHEAFFWLKEQIASRYMPKRRLGLELTILELGSLSLSCDEYAWLQKTCPYLTREYLDFLAKFRFNPSQHVQIEYTPVSADEGDVYLVVRGLWMETILYEIPLLALVSEAYFKFCDKDWSYDKQEENAYQKGLKLLQGGCIFSEFGTRRRRDTITQHMVIRGLKRAAEDCYSSSGKLTGTSNVYFAMKHDIAPIGTMAHEWFMGIAASSSDYEDATRKGLHNWCKCFGRGVLAVALTDTFGTPAFLKVFKEPYQQDQNQHQITQKATYADIFKGVRQDSGDPHEYVKMMQRFYEENSLQKGQIVFSDSLNVERSIDYRNLALQAGFQPSFGIGTFFTSKIFSTSGRNHY
jgi:nicotinate phosphoribosyltransferase